VFGIETTRKLERTKVVSMTILSAPKTRPAVISRLISTLFANLHLDRHRKREKKKKKKKMKTSTGIGIFEKEFFLSEADQSATSRSICLYSDREREASSSQFISSSSIQVGTAAAAAAAAAPAAAAAAPAAAAPAAAAPAAPPAAASFLIQTEKKKNNFSSAAFVAVPFLIDVDRAEKAGRLFTVSGLS
jgi:hypothetical protein